MQYFIFISFNFQLVGFSPQFLIVRYNVEFQFVKLFSYTFSFDNNTFNDFEDKNTVGVEWGLSLLCDTIKFNINRLEPCEAMLKNSIHQRVSFSYSF